MKKDFSKGDSNKLRILLVEDDELMGPVLQRQLQKFASSVRLVTNPKSFLVHMSSDTALFDLAVIDLGLPGLAGDYLISWMRSSNDTWIVTLPILIVTGSPERARQIIGDEFSKVQLVSKPYEVGELRDAINKLFPHKQTK